MHANDTNKFATFAHDSYFMSKDYYNVLGVGKTATQEEIKKAFREKAHLCHPDKSGGDEAKFKEINEAYQVLGNPEKRQQYDHYGSTFEQARRQGGFTGFDGFRDFSGFTNGFNIDMDDIGDIFGGIGDIFGFAGGGKRRARTRRGGDIQVILTLEFSEAVFGVDKEIALTKKVRCEHCRGNAAEPGSKIETCVHCGGSGRVTRVQRTILGNMQVQMACEHCGGEGKAYSRRCTRCGASGTVKETVKFKVKIPAGIDNGETIRLSGQGEAGEKGSQAGDLYLKVRVNNDSRFNRDGYDISSVLEIKFAQAALGDKIEVATVDGRIELKIPAGTQTGTTFKLRGKGVPRLQGHGRGDHLVTVAVKTPANLNKRQKELLRELDI